MAPYCQWMGETSERDALQGVVPAHQRLPAQLQPLVQQGPELLVPGRMPIWGRLRDDALIEAALEPVVPVSVLPGDRKERLPMGEKTLPS